LPGCSPLAMKPEDGYIAYIVNPKSGPTGTKPTSRRFSEYLIKRGFTVRVYLTRCLEDAYEMATDAAVDYDCAMIVAVGGDGTVREVMRGMEGTDKPLLIVPCGTENVLANELGLDQRLKTIVKVFEGGFARPLDLGSANGLCFTCVVGFGFDAEVVRRVCEQRTGHISYLDYFWPLWRTFWDYKFSPVKVDVDGEEIFEGRGLVFVGNVSRYAVGLKILHDADYGDGLLDICIYKCSSRLRLVKHAVMTVFKRHTACSDVIYRQGRNIRVSSDVPDIASEMDGDPGPTLPVEICVVPRAVNVMVDKDARPAGIRTRMIRAIG